MPHNSVLRKVNRPPSVLGDSLRCLTSLRNNCYPAKWDIFNLGKVLHSKFGLCLVWCSLICSVSVHSGKRLKGSLSFAAWGKSRLKHRTGKKGTWLDDPRRPSVWVFQESRRRRFEVTTVGHRQSVDGTWQQKVGKNCLFRKLFGWAMSAYFILILF